MDAIVKKITTAARSQILETVSGDQPSRKEAEDAVRTLIAWAGDNPNREGLLDTPKRVVNAFTEFFGGYGEDPADVLSRTFDEAGG